MIDIKSLVRKNILSLKPYSSARDEFSGTSGIFMDANENPFGTYNRYPDPYQNELKKEVSALKNIPAENIFLGNGSDEVIDLIYRIFCNPGADMALSFSPTYGMYEVSANINDVKYITVPLNSRFEIDTESVIPLLRDKQLKLIFICSPNNPTSNCMYKDAVLRILDEFRGIVVIDEAYIDFSGKDSYARLLAKYNNLIVVQTFSKAWGLAGVRVGMAFTNTEIISLFNKVKPPYNISKVNQQAVLDKIRDRDAFHKEVALILEERKKLEKKLHTISCIKKIFPSDANYILAEVENASSLYGRLVEKGIIIRNRHGQVKNCVRITVGTPEENQLLLQTLNSVI